MATSSPYSNNDYSGVQTRPFNLPVNDIMKAFVAKNQYWEDGARRIKSVYDNALNLSLTKDGNKQIKDDFLIKAQEEIKKLSSSDLGDIAVQKAGISVFTPLFKDDGIMSDDQATKYIHSTNQDALSYRDKDGGKEYSATNHAYALDGANEFNDSNNKDRFAGRKYLEQKKQYVPYYDTTTEMLNIQSKCGDTSNTNVSIEQGYMKTITDSGIPEDKLKGCIVSGLSDKARKQFSINGYVAYGKNYGALASDYDKNLINSEATIKNIIAKNEGYLSAVGKNSLSPEMKQLYQSKNENLTRSLVDIQQSRQKITSGDYSEVKDKYETISGSIFSDRAINNFASSFFTNKHDVKLQADGWQMALLTQQGLNTRQDIDFKNDKTMETLKHENAMELMFGKSIMGGKNGLSIGNPYNTPDPAFGAGEETQTTTYDNLIKTIDSTSNNYNKEIEDMFIFLKNSNIDNKWLHGKDVNYFKTPEGVKELYNYINVYTKGLLDVKDLKTLSQLKPFFDNLSGYRQAIDINSEIKNKVDSQIAPEVKAKFDNQLASIYNGFKPFMIDGRLIDGNRQKAILNGYDNDYKVEIGSGGGGILGDMTSGNYGKTYAVVDKRTGRIVPISNEFNKATTDYSKLMDATKSEFKGKADDVLGKQYSTQVATFNIDKSRESNIWKERFASRLAPSDKDFDKQIGVLNSKLNGTATFRIPKSFGSGNDKTEMKQDKIKETLSKEYGISTIDNVKDSPDGNFIDITIKHKSFDFTSNYSQNRDALMLLANIAQQELNSGKTTETNRQIAQSMSPNNSHAYSINVDRNKNSYIYDKTMNKMILGNIPFERGIELYNGIINGSINSENIGNNK